MSRYIEWSVEQLSSVLQSISLILDGLCGWAPSVHPHILAFSMSSYPFQVLYAHSIYIVHSSDNLLTFERLLCQSLIASNQLTRLLCVHCTEATQQRKRCWSENESTLKIKIQLGFNYAPISADKLDS